MKKYGMIFASAILALTILLIPNQKVNAATYTYDINTAYSFENLGGVTTNQLLDTIDFLKSIEDDYYVLLTYQSGTYYYKVFILDKDNINITQSTFYYSSKTYQIYLTTSGTSNYISSEFRNYSFDTEINNLKNNFNNGNFTTSTNIANLISCQSGQAYLLYSNIDFKINNIGSTNAIIYNGENMSVGDIIPSWYDVYDRPIIDISSGYICDLEGKDAEYVTIDFSDFTDSSYKYQYGIKRQSNIDYIQWYDIEALNNYIYNYNEYFNQTTIYARVLDSDGNEIAQNVYTINNSELPSFGLNISSNLASPVSNYDGDPLAEVITVDFRNAYFENYRYYYSYDTKTKYEFDVTSDSLVQYLTEYLYNFIYFYVYDENDNLIYYTYNDVSSSNRLGYFPDDYSIRRKVLITEGPACDLQGNKKIHIKMDFSNITKYVNHYDFDVVINGDHLGPIQYYEVVLDEINNLQDYSLEVYIDTFLYYSRNYKVGYLNNNEPIQGEFDDKEFNDLYDEILSNISSENIENNENLFNLFINALNHFRDVIVNIFNDCSYVFNNLEPVLKYFYISVFSLILFGFLIKFIL